MLSISLFFTSLLFLGSICSSVSFPSPVWNIPLESNLASLAITQDNLVVLGAFFQRIETAPDVTVIDASSGEELWDSLLRFTSKYFWIVATAKNASVLAAMGCDTYDSSSGGMECLLSVWTDISNPTITYSYTFYGRAWYDQNIVRVSDDGTVVAVSYWNQKQNKVNPNYSPVSVDWFSTVNGSQLGHYDTGDVPAATDLWMDNNGDYLSIYLHRTAVTNPELTVISIQNGTVVYSGIAITVDSLSADGRGVVSAYYQSIAYWVSPFQAWSFVPLWKFTLPLPLQRSMWSAVADKYVLVFSTDYPVFNKLTTVLWAIDKETGTLAWNSTITFPGQHNMVRSGWSLSASESHFVQFIDGNLFYYNLTDTQQANKQPFTNQCQNSCSTQCGVFAVQHSDVVDNQPVLLLSVSPTKFVTDCVTANITMYADM